MLRKFRRVGWAVFALAWGAVALGQGDPPAIKLALDAEFGVKESTSAQAIRAGIRIAIDEINRSGGVLGRPLILVERDNRSVPARSRANLRELAADPEVVAVFCGRFSPVVVDVLPDIHALKLPLLDPWAAADGITDNGYRPNYVFRLSLRDSWAIGALFGEMERRGLGRVGLLLANTEWGRSSLKAAREQDAVRDRVEIVDVQWYNWGDNSMIEPYRAIRKAGAQGVLLVANPQEGAILVNEMAERPAEERLPVLSHWGVAGGRMFQATGGLLAEFDFSVVQTFSFIGAEEPAAQRVAAAAMPLLGAPSVRAIPSPGGVAHAYDLTYILARAIALAGSTDRAAVRDALERVADYRGLTGNYPHPFTPERHDALDPGRLFMARYGDDGALEPLPPQSLPQPAPGGLP